MKTDKKQSRYKPGKSTVDTNFALRQLQQTFGTKKKELFHVSVDLGKVFDRIPREAIR